MKKQKCDMLIREKNKSEVYQEREKVMAHDSTLDRLSRQLHGHFGRLLNIRNSWINPKSHAQAKVSINTSFLNLVCVS